jgi:hypothetical protein
VHLRDDDKKDSDGDNWDGKGSYHVVETNMIIDWTEEEREESEDAEALST